MTSVFDPQVLRTQSVLDEAMADYAVGRALDQARSLGGRAGLGRLAEYRRRIAAVEAEILADHVQDDGNTARAERLLNDGKTSKAEQRRKAARARAIAKNKALAAKLASGEMSEEQVDVIADASAKTDGHAAVDDGLIDEVASMPPEQGRSKAREFVAKRATRDGVQSEHERQRALRRAARYYSKAKSMDCISLDSDGASNKVAWNAIEKRAKEIYERDGGSDLPDRKHPRTREQRLHDATFELLTGKVSTLSGHREPTNDEIDASNKSKDSGLPQIVVGVTVDHLSGNDPAAMATQIGLGLIPDSVLADYAANADIWAAIYDRNGQTLWLKRLNRFATSTQRIALIMRDQGCVLCGADHTRCQAHHLMPWNAPGKGQTNLDELALLCEPCHRRLHTEQRTLYQDTAGTWRTRPATPHETPPQPAKSVRSRPTTNRNRVKRE